MDDGTTTHLAEIAQTLGLTVDQPAAAPLPTVDLPSPPLKSRKLESRLMMLLGAGFGLGVALTLSRLLADLTPGLTIAGAVACAAIGLATHRLGGRHARAAPRPGSCWTDGPARPPALVQSAVEQQVATRVLAAESSLTAALSVQDEGESTRVAEQVSAIDTELREHSVVGARAAALRGQEMPTVQAALTAVRAELGEPEPADDDETASDDADEESEVSVPDDGDAEQIDENSPTSTADNVF